MIELPFVLHGRSGVLGVDYRANQDIVESGFDLFDPRDFDPHVALGYPTMRAWVERYGGTGYRTATGFLQWVDTERHFHDRVQSAREMDAPPELLDAGVPLFAHGYPASLYDAPAHNMNGADWMGWQATTWFVTTPARWTGYRIRPLAGFTWGYTEEATGSVQLAPFRVLEVCDWVGAIPWLNEQRTSFTFAS